MIRLFDDSRPAQARLHAPNIPRLAAGTVPLWPHHVESQQQPGRHHPYTNTTGVGNQGGTGCPRGPARQSLGGPPDVALRWPPSHASQLAQGAFVQRPGIVVRALHQQRTSGLACEALMRCVCKHIAASRRGEAMPAPTTLVLQINDEWKITADDLQWMLQRGKVNGGWYPISFVSSTKAVLARCMAEAGVPQDAAERALAALPDTFAAWHQGARRLDNVAETGGGGPDQGGGGKTAVVKPARLQRRKPGTDPAHGQGPKPAVRMRGTA
jgi:hypothetical protein